MGSNPTLSAILQKKTQYDRRFQRRAAKLLPIRCTNGPVVRELIARARERYGLRALLGIIADVQRPGF